MEDPVRIVVYDPTHHNKIVHEYQSTRGVLEKSEQFKSWFHELEVYGDYVEIGDNGYSGLSNLMLSNKWSEHPYLLSINCAKFTHNLGMLNPPIIENILDYLNGKEITLSNIEYRGQLFSECLYFLKIN